MGPTGASENKEVGRVHVAIIAKDYFLVRRMDFGDNDRLDNKKSFASFALGLALEALDKVDSNNSQATRISKKEGPKKKSEEIDISSLDSLSEEWEGELTWKSSKKTVVQDISKVDLASSTDWNQRNRLISKIDRYYHERYLSVALCMVSENWAVRYRKLTDAGLIVLGSDAKEKIESLSSILPMLEAARSSDVKLLDSKTIDDLLSLVPDGSRSEIYH
ncbi:MAG: CinA family protein [Candidatus Thalassarchaeaceae archaeon]